MIKFLKKLNFRIRRRSFLPMLLITGAIVVMLFFNEDTSVALNMEYDSEINRLTQEIMSCKDSAEYFRSRREAIIHENGDLEQIARENFHMQLPEEDVYIIR